LPPSPASLGQILATEDGSLSLIHPDHGEAYHSRLGADTEARLLYIEASGIQARFAAAAPLAVLDVGLGLGYNAIHTLEAWANAASPGPLQVVSLEINLALVEAPRILAAPLWQHPQLGVSPVVGDELVLVGSPFGLEGTVTSGVVSRVTYDAIQTDAAANPGNSGGPAVNRSGEVVGVLLAGGAENLNFAVPIQRACVTVRKC